MVDDTMNRSPMSASTSRSSPRTQAIDNFAGQQIAAALTGKATVDAALDAAAKNSDRVLQKAGGYFK